MGMIDDRGMLKEMSNTRSICPKVERHLVTIVKLNEKERVSAEAENAGGGRDPTETEGLAP